MRQRYAILYLLLFLMPALVKAQSSSLEFIENKGQWDDPFQYKSITGKGEVYLQKDGITYFIGHPANKDLSDAYKHGSLKEKPVLKYHAYKMVFENAKVPKLTGSKAAAHYYNYFLGNDRTKWKTGIHPFHNVDYAGLYNGIDMHVASENNNLKYEFIVKPGADVAQLRMRFDGADKLSVKNGNLIIATSVGDVQELQPYTYQYIQDQRVIVPCRYKLNGNTVTYSFPDGYDATQTLVIDPTVVFSTFTGSTADNWGFTATYDEQGYFYSGGIVAGLGFPLSTGAYQTTYGGNPLGSPVPGDMAFIKYNPSGTAMMYATYLGGSDLDQPHSMMVDANNNLVIAGRTFSNNFPVSTNAYDNSINGRADIVVTKFNAGGTLLLGSTYIGGSGDEGVNIFADETTFGSLKYNYGDDARSEVILDRNAYVYVTAATNSPNFPLVNPSQSNLAGNQDAVVFKFSPNLDTLKWSTYLGGSEDDAGYVLALDTGQAAVFVAGGTRSPNFPYTASVYQGTYQGGPADGYIAKYTNSGSYGLQKLTSIGTSNYDQVYGVQVDAANRVYAMGQSLGGTFPVSQGVYSNASSSQFIIKLDNGLTTKIFSTVFGSGDPTHTNISPVAFLVDTCENIYISGWGGDLDIPTMNATVGTTNGMPVTPAQIPANGLMKATTDGADFYFIVLSKDALSLLYGAFYGRTSATAFMGEHVDGGTSRFDKSGIIYQAICGGCGGSAGPPLPTTPNSYSPLNGSSNCNLASLKIAFEFILVAKASILPDTQGCAPLTVQLQNNSTYAVGYEWNFGDNSPTDFSQNPPPHTYTIPGTYIIRLIVKNPTACNKTADTAYLTVKVIDASITSDFNFTVTDSCNPYRVVFNNTSTYSNTPGSQSFTVFHWSFGDNTSFTGPNPPPHNYADTGSYLVTLIMIDTTACNNPDTIQKLVRINKSFVEANFSGPDSLCIGTDAVFTGFSTNAQTVKWDFGDNTTSTTSSPIHTYADTGTYTIILIAANPNTCNKFDTVTRTIKVMSAPIADFIFAPIVPVTNEPIQFTNQSINATSYVWAFGDGSGSTEEHPKHMYKKTGTYTVCLTAINKSGCADTICKKVDADIVPAIGVPTAFSPNGDGANDILYVRGAAVETLNFKVFNRWGELVFETRDMNIGWDGTYKGKPQEMEVYAFTLYATFIDGTTAHRQGNVTLLR